MLIPNIFAVAALLFTLASGLPLGANKESLSKRAPIPPYGRDRMGNQMPPGYLAAVHEAMAKPGATLEHAKAAASCDGHENRPTHDNQSRASRVSGKAKWGDLFEDGNHEVYDGIVQRNSDVQFSSS
ncbi:hypothetical protein HYFRA_00011206 [Hymenoscyphus fraxineus]|uniref:Uncharacterized protein n=1 Tax=Hymenoscyphus fraxineus TaxID=746836 RepID=A0A9N9L4E5_9HELO|nr:hypothetical protein HYFRA_00011206 [Hymenoscyphus fraxineus]